MLSWLGHRGARARGVEADAETLVREYGQQAYSVARRREQKASGVRMAEEWTRIAAVACKTQERVVLTTGTRMPMGAHAEPGRMTNERNQPPIFDALSRLEELERNLMGR